MSLRRILAMLIACAMLFAPVAAPASAMVPGDAHAQTMAAEHCGDQSPDEMETDDPCCVAIGAAIAAAPVSRAGPQDFAHLAECASVPQFVTGDLAELATPPPRLA